jgi:hypothetical protein
MSFGIGWTTLELSHEAYKVDVNGEPSIVSMRR